VEAPFPVKAYALLDGSSDGFPPVTMRAPFVAASEMLLDLLDGPPSVFAPQRTASQACALRRYPDSAL